MHGCCDHGGCECRGDGSRREEGILFVGILKPRCFLAGATFYFAASFSIGTHIDFGSECLLPPFRLRDSVQLDLLYCGPKLQPITTKKGVCQNALLSPV